MLYSIVNDLNCKSLSKVSVEILLEKLDTLSNRRSPKTYLIALLYATFSFLLHIASHLPYTSHPYVRIGIISDLTNTILVFIGVKYCDAHKERNTPYTFPTATLMWLLQVSVLLKVIPKFLAVETYSMGSLLRMIVGK